MLLEAAVEIEAAPTWGPENKYSAQTEWQSVDRALRTIVGRRAAIDADEARWLREAEAIQIATAGAQVGAAIHSNAHVGAVANRNAHVGAPTKLDAAILGTQVKEALVGRSRLEAGDGPGCFRGCRRGAGDGRDTRAADLRGIAPVSEAHLVNTHPDPMRDVLGTLRARSPEIRGALRGELWASAVVRRWRGASLAGDRRRCCGMARSAVESPAPAPAPPGHLRA